MFKLNVVVVFGVTLSLFLKASITLPTTEETVNPKINLLLVFIFTPPFFHFLPFIDINVTYFDFHMDKKCPPNRGHLGM
jgi:hypothetical protein